MKRTGTSAHSITTVLLLLSVLLTWTALAPNAAHAQQSGDAAKAAAREVKRRVEAAEALDTLASMLKAEREQVAAIKEVKQQLEGAKEEATKKELADKIKLANEKLAQLRQQITALTTGVSADEMKDDPAKSFNLQAELESAIQPFIKMIRDATENARQISKLKRTISVAQKRQRVAQRAISRLTLLLDVGEKQKSLPIVTRRHIAQALESWKKQEKDAVNLQETAEQQLNIRLDEEANASGGLGSYATQFLRNRGLNLLLAIAAFGGVFLAMALILRVARWVQDRQRIPRVFVTRLAALLFRIISVVAAFLVMFLVLNTLNDWFLLGIISLFSLAAAWIGVKMLPNIIEQVTLLLNLGAVQEDERVMLAGVPWRVDRLDLYTDLTNPALDGGTFTLPVRELVGLHSRPAAEDEPWFPTNKDDWILLEDNHVGRVVSQTPELVQVEELGGSLVTYETSAFLAKAPRNLSPGFRMKIEFGLDYRHQSEATTTIPDRIQSHVRGGLEDLLGDDLTAQVEVDLLKAADSAIVFEIEATFPGRFAPRYEDIEREIARLLVDACNQHNWTIPFPQLVMHRPAAG